MVTYKKFLRIALNPTIKICLISFFNSEREYRFLSYLKHDDPATKSLTSDKLCFFYKQIFNLCLLFTLDIEKVNPFIWWVHFKMTPFSIDINNNGYFLHRYHDLLLRLNHITEIHKILLLR